jgi:high frequency lysogenization protein
MVTNLQTLSLAAVMQCCILVQRLARTGSADQNNLARMVRTALNLSTLDPVELYGGTGDVRDGLRMLADLAGARPDADAVEVLRMTHSALRLQGSLRASESHSAALGNRLESLAKREWSIPFSDELYFALNEIYTETLSPLSPRIVVNGAEGHLQNAVLVAKVRSALLAAVRNGYLWHQLGGRRWRLLFGRARTVEQARNMLVSG